MGRGEAGETEGGGMKSLIFVAWFITRFTFVFLWTLAEPVGRANVWLKEKYLAY